MSWAPELRGLVLRPDGDADASWEPSRRWRPGTYNVCEFGVWGTPGWVTESRTYSAVVDDFGDLVRVP